MASSYRIKVKLCGYGDSCPVEAVLAEKHISGNYNRTGKRRFIIVILKVKRNIKKAFLFPLFTCLYYNNIHLLSCAGTKITWDLLFKIV